MKRPDHLLKIFPDRSWRRMTFWDSLDVAFSQLGDASGEITLKGEGENRILNRIYTLLEKVFIYTYVPSCSQNVSQTA